MTGGPRQDNIDPNIIFKRNFFNYNIMSLTLDANQLWGTGLSALAIASGVVTKNSVKFLIKDGKLPGDGWQFWVSTIIGMIMFIGGWIGMGLYTKEATGGVNEPWIWLGVVSILVAVLLQNAPMTVPALLMGILFIGGWAVFGWAAAGGVKSKLALTLPAAGLVVSAMALGVLGWQRKNCVIDGPGYPMFMLAWGLLTLSNSL